jgi:hypothetical protein
MEVNVRHPSRVFMLAVLLFVASGSRGQPAAKKVCGQKVVTYQVVFCNAKPLPQAVKAGVIAASGADAAKECDCLDNCPQKRKCVVNHVVLQGTPDCQIRPTDECPGKKRAWVCFQKVTFDCICR